MNVILTWKNIPHLKEDSIMRTKTIAGAFLSILFVLVISSSMLAPAVNAPQAGKVDDVTELRNIILYILSLGYPVKGIPQFDDADESITQRELRNMMFLFNEAKANQYLARGVDYEHPVVISGIAFPCPINDLYIIGFARQEYVELFDLIAYFTEIPYNMIKPSVWGVFRRGL